jgi:hypothetical protein
MKKLDSVLMTLSFLIVSCSNSSRIDKTFVEIDISEIPKENNSLHLKNFTDTIEYIKLEINNNCVIGGSPNFFVDGDTIISIAFRQILLFSRRDGKFIREIGKNGRGPDEYAATMGCYFENHRIVPTNLYKANTFYLYDLSGMANHKLWLGENFYIKTFAFMADNSILGYKPNMNGNDSIWLVNYDTTGKILKTYKNFLFFNDTPRVFSFGQLECKFYYYNNKLNIKQLFNDTLYCMNGTMLYPRYVFNIGENAMPYGEFEKSGFRSYWKKYCYVLNICENEDFIFFEIHFNYKIYPSYFDKQQNKVYISNDTTEVKKGFINDVDGFLPFNPLYINNEGEMIDFALAVDIDRWFKDRTKRSSLPIEELEELKKIRPEDNPVVMIAKPKQGRKD